MKYKFRPFSANVTFLDTEFSSLNPYKIWSWNMTDRLVIRSKKILFLLLQAGKKVSRGEAVKQITNFIGTTEPYAVSYVNQFDTLYAYKLFGTDKHPFFWLPINFASILFGMGIDPEFCYPLDKNNFFGKIGVDASNYQIHNALDDAKLLREAYVKMVSSYRPIWLAFQRMPLE